jgi:hypothetical protein
VNVIVNGRPGSLAAAAPTSVKLVSCAKVTAPVDGTDRRHAWSAGGAP